MFVWICLEFGEVERLCCLGLLFVAFIPEMVHQTEDLMYFCDESAGVGDDGFLVCTSLKDIHEIVPVSQNVEGIASTTNVPEPRGTDVGTGEAAYLNCTSTNPQ
jgi:hypothetical protein